MQKDSLLSAKSIGMVCLSSIAVYNGFHGKSMLLLQNLLGFVRIYGIVPLHDTKACAIMKINHSKMYYEERFMKKYQKNVALCLLIAMLTSMTTACGDGKTNETTSNTIDTTATVQETETELTDGLPEKDMDGFTLRIFHNNPTQMTWTNLTLDAQEQTGEVLNDAIYGRNREIEERFNSQLDVVECEVFQLGVAEVRKEVQAGDSNYDLWYLRDYNVAESIPYLTTLDKLPYCDLTADWWFPEASSLFRYDGRQYAAANSFSLSPISRAGGIIFDKDMYNRLGQEKSLYDYVRDGEWTIDAMHSIAEVAVQDVNGDGKMSDGDIFGIGSSWKEMYARFINGSGISYIEQDEKGYPVYNLLQNENAIDKLMHIYELFQKGNVYVNTGKDAEALALGTIEKQDVLFVLGHPNSLGVKYRDSEQALGFLPSPKYDTEQEEYHSPTWAFEILTLLKTLPADRTENVSILLEALSFSSHFGVMDTYKEVMMKSKYARDPESEEMFDIVLNSIYFDFGLVIWEGDVANKIIGNIYASGKGTVVSSLTELSNPIQKLIDDLVEAIEEDKALNE